MRTVLPSLRRTDNATILPNVIELREKPTYVDIAYSFLLTRSVAKRCLHILPSVGSRSVEENQSLSLPISLSAEFVGGGVERGKGSLLRQISPAPHSPFTWAAEQRPTKHSILSEPVPPCIANKRNLFASNEGLAPSFLCSQVLLLVFSTTSPGTE